MKIEQNHARRNQVIAITIIITIITIITILVSEMQHHLHLQQ
jgi:hypothetical protein